MTASRQRELRLALVCYGGVSLAVYMHGVTKELWQLLRASEARACGRLDLAGASAGAWRALLEALGPQLDLRVIADVLTGASAGGINALLLGLAIAEGRDLDAVTPLWLDGADVDRMLDPAARARSPLSGLYKRPVAWVAARRSESLASIEDETLRREVTQRLASFMRARWFEPPFSGPGFAAMLLDAMDEMDRRPSMPVLVPPGLPLDVSVTATDWHGRVAQLPLHSPAQVSELQHRRLLRFRSAPGAPGQRSLGERPALAFAARATASFPGAFPPATLTEMDRLLEARGRSWPGRARFAARELGAENADDVLLIDGSVLDNAPFGPALETVAGRWAAREVDRRFVYVDPKPGIGLLRREARPPGFFSTILRALAELPREQPIHDSLVQIARLRARMARIARVLDAMTPSVDAAVERAVGPGVMFRRLTPERLGRARARIQSVAAAEAGFAFAGYAHLKLSQVLEQAAALAGRALGDPTAAATLSTRLADEARQSAAFDHTGATQRDPGSSAYVQLLRALDLGFRRRRLRFVQRQLAAARPHERAYGLKLALAGALQAFGTAVETTAADQAVAEAARAALAAQAGPAEARALIEALGRALALTDLDRAADSAFVAALAESRLARPERLSLVRAWLGFPFYDIVLLPLVGDEPVEQVDDIRVDRISPDDAASLRQGGTRATLKGWTLNAFGAFFSRAYRENDYLWGRLHAAERLVEIVADSAAKAGHPLSRPEAWKARLFAAILDEERERLPRIDTLVAELDQEVAVLGGVANGGGDGTSVDG